MSVIQVIALSLVLFLLVQGQNFLNPKPDEELLMVYEITRHGARTGIRLDYFNTSWVQGELTEIGKRQHYLLGREMRQRYINDLKFLDESYNPKQIYVRSTDLNRTIESAMSQLQGLYPSNFNSERLIENQTQHALPPFNISEDIIKNTNSKLGLQALPFSIKPIQVHVSKSEFDEFEPWGICPLLNEEDARRWESEELNKYLMQKYNDTIQRMALAMHQDPTNFTGIQAATYADSLWARYFDQYTMPGFDQALILEVQQLKADHFNYTNSGNETTRKIFLTGTFAQIVKNYRNTIDLDSQGQSHSKDRLKLYYQSDHDNMIQAVSQGLEYQLPEFPPFASIILFELRRKGSQYYVNATINDVKIPLLGKCQGQYQCEFHQFVELVKDITLFENDKEWTKLCGRSSRDQVRDLKAQWNDTKVLLKEQSPVSSQYINIFYMYIAMMTLVGLYQGALALNRCKNNRAYNEVQ